jgi:hypothetical protein
MFCRTNSRNKWKVHKKRRKSAKQNAYFRKAQRRKMEKPNTTSQPGRGTTIGEVQAHQATDHAKAVMSRGDLGAGAPRVWLHPGCCQVGPASSGDSKAVH